MAQNPTALRGRQGSAFARTITVPFPTLAGWGARMQIRKTPLDETALLSLAIGTGLTIISPATPASLRLAITAPQMAGLPATWNDNDGLAYDLELVPDMNEDLAFAILWGPFFTGAEVTR